MRFSLAVLGSLVAMSSQGAAAFAPKAFGVVPNAVTPQNVVQTKDDKSNRFPLAMVAGGAERAYRDDYYDGMYCVS
jgi:hypothetical protein